MKNKTLISLLILAVLLLSGVGGFCDEVEESRRLGEDLANTARQTLGTTEGMNERIIKPLISGETRMKTIQTSYECQTNHRLYPSIMECQEKCPGSCKEYQGFNAQLQCPSAVEFLKITIIPSGTNDFRLVINQDTDYDGIPDHTYSPTFEDFAGNETSYASGVCTHGVVVCSPGTWDRCTYYVWAVDENGHIILSPVPDMSGAGQCYCVNSSCGGVLTAMLADVLQDLGAGASTTLAQARDIAVTKAELALDELSIRFYGQSSSECTHVADPTYEQGSSASRTSPQALKEGYQTGALPVDEEVAAQASDPNSYYSQLAGSIAINEGHSGYFCTITHDFTTKEVINDPITGTIGTPIPPAHNNYWGKGLHVITGQVDLGDKRVISARLPLIAYDDEVRVYVNEHLVYEDWPLPPLTDRHGGIRWYGYDVAIPPQYLHSGINEFRATVSTGSDGGEGWFTYEIITAEQQQVVTSSGECSCPQNCDCSHPQDVQVCDYAGNCIYTFRGGESTGETPIPSCKAYQDPNSGHRYRICVDGTQMTSTDLDTGQTTVLASGPDMWWMVKKRYDCQENYTYQADTSRAKTAMDTANPETGEYEDPLIGTGTIPLNQFPTTYEECEMVCVVTRTRTDTTAYPQPDPMDENKATATTSPTTREYIIKQCSQDAQGNWHCPLEPGETHYKPLDAECGCIDMFPEAASAMQAVYEASRDMICSEEEP